MRGVKKKIPLTVAMLKSHVETYLRRTKGGTLSRVSSYETTRTMRPGDECYYRTADSPRARKGRILGTIRGGFHVQGKRSANSFKNPEFRLAEADVWPVEEFQAKKAPKSTKCEALSSTKRTIAVEESNRRANIGFKRLGLPERDILTHPVVRATKVAVLKKLAISNSIVPQSGGVVTDDFHDLHSSYVMALANSLRLETSKAPEKDLDDFKAHLAGKKHESRIFATITTAGRGAAIRYLQDRAKKVRELIDFQAAEEDPEMRRELDQHSTPAHQFDQVAAEQRDRLLEGYIGKLSPLHAEIIKRKFGLGPYEPQSDARIAEELNRQGFTLKGRAFNRNYVAESLRAAVAGFRELEGVGKLRDFLKSLRGHLTLLKAKRR
ncbi:MAG: hypothetical protein VB050_08175 [Geobacteraceae bacterium]|nr:hypothetical protein [Geobacteraceae bacterium]